MPSPVTTIAEHQSVVAPFDLTDFTLLALDTLPGIGSNFVKQLFGIHSEA